MRTVVQEQDTRELALPPSVQEALGELVNAAKDGLLALSVGVGLGVLAEMMEAEVDEVVGPKGKRNPDRTAVRHGHEDGEVTLGGRRVGVQRPRARTADGEHELALQTYAHFADRDPLTRVVLEQMLAGVSTRRFARTREPVGQEVAGAERSTSKSAVSREFVGRTGEHLRELMSRPLGDIRLAALMLDGIELKGRCCVVCLGVTTDGAKLPLGLWDGSTENKTVTAHLLSDLVHRGLDVEQGVLVVLDGSKALRAAVNEVFGPVGCSAAFATRNATSSSTCPNATARPSRRACAGPGPARTTRSHSTACASSPASSTDPIPAPPRHCAKASRKR